MDRTRSATLPILFAALLWCAGCGASSTMSDGDTAADGDAIADGDSADGDAGERSVHLAVTLPEAFGGPVWMTGPVPPEQAAAIRLPRLHRVNGTITLDGQPIDAQIQFEPSDGPKADGLPVVRTTVHTDASGKREPKLYSAVLFEGGYAVLIMPDQSDRLPPHLHPGGLSLDAERRLDIPLDGTQTTVRGRLVDPFDMPVEGIGVQFVEPDGPRYSTAGTTGSDGRFEAVIPRDDAVYDIRVYGRSRNQPYFPELNLSSGLTVTDGTHAFPSLETGPDGVTLRYGLFDSRPIPARGSVTRAGTGGPVENVWVVFRGQTLAGPFNTFATTGPAGTFIAGLLPGIYSVQATAAYSDRLASVVLSAEQIETERVFSIPLPPRSILSGRVVDTLGRPVDTVSITATRTAAPGGMLVKESGRSGVDGSYLLELEPGYYDVAFAPPAPTGLGWGFLPGLHVNAASHTADIQLEPAFGVDTAVSSADGSPIAGALIEVYGRIYPGADALTVVASGISAGDGTCRLLLPARYAP